MVICGVIAKSLNSLYAFITGVKHRVYCVGILGIINMKKLFNHIYHFEITEPNYFNWNFTKGGCIEIFETDLIGDIQKNISIRCLNTSEFYKTNYLKSRCSFMLYLGFKYSKHGFLLSSHKLSLLGENGLCCKLPKDLILEINNHHTSKK